MKGFAMLRIGEVGWVEKPRPVCGPLDAVCRPLAAAVCTSDVHTVWEGAVGDRHDLILGHECCAEVVETGALVKDFQPGDPYAFFLKGKGRRLLIHPATEALLEDILLKLRDEGEDAAFDYIRREVLGKK